MELGSDAPNQAGKAKLKYSSDVQTPERKGKTIVIPSDPSVEIFPLQEDYSQFLLSCNLDVWFGGTDENPFLVRMSGSVLNELFRLGISGFYDLLVPSLMKNLKKTFGGEFVRQGDIFAYPLSYSWEEIKSSKTICCGAGFTLQTTGSKGIHVFGTRHMFSGEYIDQLKLFGTTLPTVAEGMIAAPDHKDIKLAKKPHVLAQTNGLHHPQAAD